jgi:hypothetical protein
MMLRMEQEAQQSLHYQNNAIRAGITDSLTY